MGTPQDFPWASWSQALENAAAVVNRPAEVLFIDGQPGITHPLEILIYAMGAVSTAAAFLLLVWRLIRPHVERFVRDLQKDLQVVRDEVRPNHGDSLKDTAMRNERTLAQVRQDVALVALQVAHLDDRSRRTERTLDSHVTESRTYLAEAAKALQEQGVILPTMAEDETEETD